MNPAYLHIALAHLPVFGYLLFTPLFLFAVWKKKQELLTLVSVMLVILSLSAIVVFNSAEGAEEIIEEAVPGFSHDLIHEHEESGERSFWLLCISGSAAALVLALRVSLFHPKQFRLLLVMALLLLVTSASSLYTAHLGGKIRHNEAFEAPAMAAPSDEADDD